MSALTSCVLNFRHVADLRWHLGVVAKRTYTLEGGQCVPAEEQDRLLREDDEHEGGQSFRDKDTYGYKPITDVVVHGSAFALGSAVRELIVSVAVGELTRRVRVVGDRFIEDVAGQSAFFSMPVPWSTMPLTFERSYGGFDEGAARILDDHVAEVMVALGAELASVSRYTYPRNARGVGFVVDVEPKRVIKMALPNIEDPEDPLLPERLFCPSFDKWLDQPIPAALDWILPTDFPRCLYYNIVPDFSPPPGAVREVVLGATATTDMAPRSLLSPPGLRAANGGAPGLARVRLKGGEPVRITHMHPERRETSFRLPEDKPELSIRPPGCPVIPLEPALDTVYLEPNRERVSLVWSGSVPVASQYPPLELAQVEHAVRWR
jgi:hypothetical protein